MPAADKPLAIPEPALVVGLSDEKLLREALKDYHAIVNDIIAELHRQEYIPKFKIPRPEGRQDAGATLYSFPIPFLAFFGIDEQLVPTVGLSKDALVLTISESHARRLIKSSPLKKLRGPLEDPSQPLVGAVYFDWGALLDAVSPWVDYAAISFQARRVDDGDDEDKPKEKPKPTGQTKAILKQIHDVLAVARVFRGYTSCTYLDNDVLVTHGETWIQDLEK
jgi:hypothetical protein